MKYRMLALAMIVALPILACGSQAQPTDVPTEVPTELPTEVFTDEPTEEPTSTPEPTDIPEPTPTDAPTLAPTPVPTDEPERETVIFELLDINVWDDAAMTQVENELDARGVPLMVYWDTLALVSRPGLFGRTVEIVTTDDWSLWLAREGDILDVTLRMYLEVDA